MPFADKSAGVAMAAGFDLHMIQVCKPQKAAKSLGVNPERAVLMPKFIVVFSRDGQTQVRFLRYSRELVASLIDDGDFPDSLAESCREDSKGIVASSGAMVSDSGRTIPRL